MKRSLAFALLAALLLGLTACGGDIGIIGGEDGPTSIYIAGTLDEGEDETGGQETLPEEPETPSAGDFTVDGEELPYEDGLPGIEEDGTYNSSEDVSLYLYTFGHLPDNYITKNEARDLGWSGGSVEVYAPGCAIGGDRFGNREGVLPDGDYHECDIDTIGESSRGAKRLVYSDDGRIYYTEDHYETFTLLYGEE
ncbi:MAG: ribonuclease [Oscillospiraceae bacterium]|nr:ribonuclease [Oscillospiraceae bacterium]